MTRAIKQQFGLTTRTGVLAGAALALVALMVPPLPEASADHNGCHKYPEANYVFAPGELQVLSMSCTGPLPTPYGPTQIEIRNAITGSVVVRVMMSPGGPGLARTAILFPGLGPGSYEWNEVGADVSESSTFGVASDVPIISATCASGPAILDGFLGANYVRARTYQPAADTAWVCLRADAGTQTSRLGGRLEVITSDPSIPLEITASADACGDPVVGDPLSGELPRPIPVSIGDPNHPTFGPAYTSVQADLRWTNSDIAVCLEVLQHELGPVSSSIVIQGLPDAASVDVLRFVPDLNQPDSTPRPGWVGASAACRDATSGQTRLMDATVFTSSFALYSLTQGSVTSLCVRADDGSQATGGRLDVASSDPGAAAPTIVPSTTPPPIGDPSSPCVWEAFTVALLSAYYQDDPDGPALCVRGPQFALDLTVVPGTVDPPTVNWVPDT